MDFHILGPIEAISQDRTADLGPRKQRALLAILVLHANELVPIDRLIQMVWGDRTPRTAAHSLQIYVSELRKAFHALGADPLLTRSPGYLLRIDPDSIDARRFDRLVTEGSRALRAGRRARGHAAINEALRLWRGPPLSDFTYEEFAQPEIRRLEALRLHALESLAEAEMDAGRPEEVLPLVVEAIRQDPLRERPRELQMLALYRTGRHAEALRAYQQFHTLLAEELGLDPSPPIRQLQERVLLHDPSLGPPGPPGVPPPEPIVRNPYKGLQAFGEERAKESRQPEVVLVFDGPGDAGFNDMIEAGFERAVSRFGVKAHKITANHLTLQSTLRRLAEGGVPLILVGHGYGPGSRPVNAVAPDFPHIRFVVLDNPGDLPNVSYLTFSEEQGSFLVGAAAALKSQAGVIGFIGGADVQGIWKFQAGYEAGARTIDPSVEVPTAYLTEWPDLSGYSSPTLARRAARDLNEAGADVIYHAAGYSGLGLFEAARLRSAQQSGHIWAIGVDTDEYHSVLAHEELSTEFDLAAWQAHVLTSMVKRVDRAIYLALQDYAREAFTPSVREFDLASGGVDISYSGGFIDDIRPVIEDLREGIIAGEIDVPQVPPDKEQDVAAGMRGRASPS